MLLSKDAISDVFEVIKPHDHYRPGYYARIVRERTSRRLIDEVVGLAVAGDHPRALDETEVRNGHLDAAVR